ncbi:hypothetical protein [Methyloceanibacter sp.]|uniref:hypothetical protein n=1 Tax=Methyloceanibacter sp. TaxID=1965321 RepID=UPI003D6CE9BE
MRRSLLLALVAFACWVMPFPASAQLTRCIYFSGTADALIKSKAVDASQKSLREAIDKWKGETGVTGPVSETAQKPRPVPYWRSEVDPSLFLPPDVVSDTAYTLCWKGVVSPVVCTTGAKVCW